MVIFVIMMHIPCGWILANIRERGAIGIRSGLKIRLLRD